MRHESMPRALLALLLALMTILGGSPGLAGDGVSSEWVEAPVEEIELALDGSDLHAPGEAVLALPGEEEGAAEGEQPVALAESPSLDLPERIELGVGEKLQLEPLIRPEGAAPMLIWTCDNGKVASVSESGMVTALAKGTAQITVFADNGATARVALAVLAAPKKLTLTADRRHLAVGDTAQLSCALPANTAGSWDLALSKKGVVSLDGEGRVTALAEGMVTVTATAYNGVSASLKLRVAPPFEITFMSVGRNDGILIQCGGEFAYIDSGRRGQGLMAVKYMKKLSVDRLKYYIGTHGHMDHVGGAPAILAGVKVDKVLVNRSETARLIRKYASTSAERKAVKAASYRTVKAGQSFALGDATFQVLGPVKIVRCDGKKEKENVNSLILKLVYGENSFLLTGDATGAEFVSVQKANPGCLKAQVYKNAHHYAETEYAAKLCDPEYVVFCTASHDLPKSKYLSFLKKMGCKIYITAPNRNGDVTFVSDGEELSVRTAK